MEKIVNKIINESVKDADIYYSNGSTWIIFTDNKQWVIELTENKTLWYNYNFFKNLFNYLSLDVVENQHYITKWVEENVIGGVKYILTTPLSKESLIDEIIQTGVKETKTPGKDGDILSTIEWMEENNSTSYTKMIDDVIENGVKETRVCNYEDPKTGLMFVKWGVEIDDVIENGIKEVQPLPSQEGNKDWGIYYHGKEDRTKPHTEYVDEAIKTGLIKTFNG